MLVVDDVLLQRCAGPSLTQTRALQQRLVFCMCWADAEATICVRGRNRAKSKCGCFQQTDRMSGSVSLDTKSGYKPEYISAPVVLFVFQL